VLFDLSGIHVGVFVVIGFPANCVDVDDVGHVVLLAAMRPYLRMRLRRATIAHRERTVATIQQPAHRGTGRTVFGEGKGRMEGTSLLPNNTVDNWNPRGGIEGLEGRMHRGDLSFLVQRLGPGGVTYGKSRNW
jgi:hypothetical protein